MDLDDIFTIRITVNRTKLEAFVREESRYGIRDEVREQLRALLDPSNAPAPRTTLPRSSPILRRTKTTPKPAKVVTAKPVAPAQTNGHAKAETKPGEGVSVLEKILSAHPEGIKARDLKKQSGLGDGTYQYSMKVLAERNVIKKQGDKASTVYFPKGALKNAAPETAAPAN